MRVAPRFLDRQRRRTVRLRRTGQRDGALYRVRQALRLKRTLLLANQPQHFATPLEARPPDRVVARGIALQAKRGIVREQRTHGFDATAAEHRAVRPMERPGRDRTSQWRDSAFPFDA